MYAMITLYYSYIRPSYVDGMDIVSVKSRRLDLLHLAYKTVLPPGDQL